MYKGCKRRGGICIEFVTAAAAPFLPSFLPSGSGVEKRWFHHASSSRIRDLEPKDLFNPDPLGGITDPNWARKTRSSHGLRTSPTSRVESSGETDKCRPTCSLARSRVRRSCHHFRSISRPIKIRALAPPPPPPPSSARTNERIHAIWGLTQCEEAGYGGRHRNVNTNIAIAVSAFQV